MIESDKPRGLPPASPPQSSVPPDPPEPIPSELLLRGAREVLIRHAGEIYRLRLTRNGKLILHK